MDTNNNRGAGLEVLFVALALLGLAGTWVQAIGYLDAGFLGGNLAFWKDTVTTPAATFIVVDILVLATASFVWMFAEGRRLGIGGAWLWGYYLGSVVIGISFAFPLFLAHRQRALRRTRPQDAAAPRGGDWIAVALAVAIALGAVLYSLTHLPG